jgi:tRNA A-37 threonylcarbamoyl transferase component Bud32
MPETPLHDPATQDGRFEEVVEQFLREREAGRNPDPQRYLHSFPDLAPQLRDFFVGLDLFDRLAPELAPRTRPAPPLPGERVGDFDLLEEVGRGGMGVVYRARHTKLDRVVALKMIRRGQDEAELARFRVEAEAIARLQHPNIVQVFEVGEHAGVPFCALEYCAGGSLAERLRGTTLLPAEAAAVVAALAEAMQAAHRQNVIHRDLKPANVLLAGGDAVTPLGRLIPKVTDFGLARKLDDPGLTQSGVILGTPSYMAPEQARGDSKAVGPPADVYALGAVLYECLTGRPPFRAATTLDTLAQVLDAEPVPPRQLNPALPRDLETICLKCLRKEPQRRYPDAAALADDLRRFLQGEPIRARPVGHLERAAKWVRRNPAVAASLTSVVLVLVTATVVSLSFWAAASDRAKQLGIQGVALREANTGLEQANAKLTEQRDGLLTGMAESMARSLVKEPGPLTDEEIEMLWRPAENPGVPLGVRFVEVSLRKPVTIRPLRNRAPWAWHAAVGLDADKRAQAERALVQALQKSSAPEQQRDMALVLAQVGVQDHALAGKAATALSQAMFRTTDPLAL